MGARSPRRHFATNLRSVPHPAATASIISRSSFFDSLVSSSSTEFRYSGLSRAGRLRILSEMLAPVADQYLGAFDTDCVCPQWPAYICVDHTN